MSWEAIEGNHGPKYTLMQSRDAIPDAILHFGKYKERRLSEINDLSYFNWMMGTDMPKELLDIVHNWYASGPDYHDPESF